MRFDVFGVISIEPKFKNRLISLIRGFLNFKGVRFGSFRDH
jgi:hypothetical protein